MMYDPIPTIYEVIQTINGEKFTKEIKLYGEVDAVQREMAIDLAKRYKGNIKLRRKTGENSYKNIGNYTN